MDPPSESGSRNYQCSIAQFRHKSAAERGGGSVLKRAFLVGASTGSGIVLEFSEHASTARQECWSLAASEFARGGPVGTLPAAPSTKRKFITCCGKAVKCTELELEVLSMCFDARLGRK